MPLFVVKQTRFDGTLVVGARRAVAADGWWVFQDAAGRPLAALPVTEVDAIESVPEDDPRGRALAARSGLGGPQGGNPAGASSGSSRALWSGVQEWLTAARAARPVTAGSKSGA